MTADNSRTEAEEIFGNLVETKEVLIKKAPVSKQVPAG